MPYLFLSIRHFLIFFLFTSQQRKTSFPFPLRCDPDPMLAASQQRFSAPVISVHL
ncbi:hypothetical protein V6Z11_D12G164400 [Gossypium hirsutum]